MDWLTLQLGSVHDAINACSLSERHDGGMRREKGFQYESNLCVHGSVGVLFTACTRVTRGRSINSLLVEVNPSLVTNITWIGACGRLSDYHTSCICSSNSHCSLHIWENPFKRSQIDFFVLLLHTLIQWSYQSKDPSWIKRERGGGGVSGHFFFFFWYRNFKIWHFCSLGEGSGHLF